MSPAPFTEIDGLSWTPVGPGPDPAVLLETRLVVNDATFRILGFRVPMPRSAGWSRNVYWEDDKGLHGQGLLWDVEGFRDFVRRVDEAPEDGGEAAVVEGETVALDAEMLRLAGSWRAVSAALRWPGQDWRPAIVGGQPYILVGHPEGPARGGLPACRISLPDGRGWFGRPDRQHRFNMRIHGGLCGIACAEIRMLDAGGRPATGPLNPAAAGWLAEVDAVLRALPGAGKRVPFHVDGRVMQGLLAPVDAEAWAFDADGFVARLAGGLGRGRMRWELGLPLGRIDDDLARLLEGLAGMARGRTLGRIGLDPCLACRPDELPRLFGLPDPGAAGIRELVHARLGRVTLRGIGHREDGTSRVHLGRVAERIYILPDRLYLCVTAAFANLACASPPAAMLGLAGDDVLIETELVDDPAASPAWAGSLPVIVDTPVRALLAEVADLSGGA